MMDRMREAESYDPDGGLTEEEHKGIFGPFPHQPVQSRHFGIADSTAPWAMSTHAGTVASCGMTARSHTSGRNSHGGP